MFVIAAAVLQNIGAVFGLWGIVWRMWDRNAMAPGYLCGVGIVALIAGGGLILFARSYEIIE